MKLHCSNINNWIVFFPEHVAPCCAALEIEPPKMPFTGGAFSMETYQQWIKDLCRLNQTPQGPCRGCRYLLPTENINTNVRLRMITLGNFYTCNAKCSFCSSWKIGQTIKQKFELTEPVKFMISNGLIEDGAHFYWSGGEATILPEFAKLFQLIRSNGFRQTVLTSGIKFSPELAAGLANDQAKLELSLDAGTPETYLTFKGTSFFPKIVKNITRYASNPLAANNISLKYIMSNQNCSDADIDGFIAVTKKAHITNVILSPEIYENKNRITSPHTIEQMSKFISRCTTEGLPLVIKYDLFTREYKTALEDSLAGRNRDAVPLEYKLCGSEIIFGKGGNSIQYQVSGWSFPEDGLTWTDGQRAVLKIPVPVSDTDLELILKAAPFLDNATKAQALILVVNRQEVGRITVSTNDWIDYSFTIPKICTNGSALQIELGLPKAVAAGNEAGRVLGIAVKSLVIRLSDPLMQANA